MGIITEKEIEENKGLPNSLERCFFCGGDMFTDEKSTGAVVFWHGAGQEIALHQGCAELLAIHLIQDARSLASAVKGRNQLGITHKKENESVWFMK